MPYMNNPPYYLTAYGIAVKHGFVGSERKWLKSLKGEPGTGLCIVDSFENEAALRERYPNGLSATDGFCRVGMDDNNYLLYYWDAIDRDWYSISLSGPSGPKGEKGPPPSPVSESYAYAIGTSSTLPPEEGWVERITDPDSVKGKVVWTRSVITWDNGEQSTVYASAYNGGDATGAVISINGKDGIVNLVAENINCDDEEDIQTHLNTNEENIGELQEDVGAVQEKIGSGELITTAQTLIGAVNEQQDAIAEMAYTVSGRNNPNLLDNWWFGPGMINQRGESYYNSDNAASDTPNYYSKCTIDRWFLGNDKTQVDVDSDGFICVAGNSGIPYLEQILPESVKNAILGKKLTLSILTPGSTDNLFTVSGSLPAELPAQETVLLNIGNACELYSDGRLKVRLKAVSSGSFSFLAVKLELGAKQSLARLESGTWVVNEIPNQTTELLKCQRYLVPLEGIRVRAYEVTQNAIEFQIPLPVKKAENIVNSTTFGNESGAKFQVKNLNGTAQSSFGFGEMGSSGNRFHIHAEKTNHGLSDAVLTATGMFWATML